MPDLKINISMAAMAAVAKATWAQTTMGRHARILVIGDLNDMMTGTAREARGMAQTPPHPDGITRYAATDGGLVLLVLLHHPGKQVVSRHGVKTATLLDHALGGCRPGRGGA